MKVSISLPDELVHYVDDRVENRSRLIEGLLQAWRKQQEKQAMVEDAAWQQAAIIDWEVSG